VAASDHTIALETPIKKYFPGFELRDEDAATNLTVNDLLRHRSGFGGYSDLPKLSGASREEIFDRQKYLQPSCRLRERLIYSNLGYSMAGYVVGERSGTTWERFVTERILVPLGMNSTCFGVEEMKSSGDYSVGYVNLLDFEHPDRYGVGVSATFSPAGGIVSNVEDMVKWLALNLGDGTAGDRRLVTTEQLRILHTPHTDLSSDPDADRVTYQGYGYGWWAETYRGYNHVYHGGLGDGYISQVSLLPEEEFGIVVLTNLYYAHFNQALIYHVFDRILGLPEMDHFERGLTGVRGYMSNWLVEHRAFWDNADDTRPSARELEQITGTYHNPAWGRVLVHVQDGKCGLTFASGYQLRLRHYDGDTYATEDDRMQIFHKPVTFEAGKDGRIETLSIALEDGVDPIRFVR
jgi:CubicO group peptidase (beta-lactamase class C family)